MSLDWAAAWDPVRCDSPFTYSHPHKGQPQLTGACIHLPAEVTGAPAVVNMTQPTTEGTCDFSCVLSAPESPGFPDIHSESSSVFNKNLSYLEWRSGINNPVLPPIPTLVKSKFELLEMFKVICISDLIIVIFDITESEIWMDLASKLFSHYRPSGDRDNNVCITPVLPTSSVCCVHNNLYCLKTNKQTKKELGMVVHIFNPSRAGDAGGSLSTRPAWSKEWVSEQPGLHRETLSQN